MKLLLLPILILLLISSLAYSEEEADTTTKASPSYTKEEKAKMLQYMGILYVGLKKEELRDMWGEPLSITKEDNMGW